MSGDRRLVTNEISLYFHIPFCRKKCPYCHFYVIPDQPEARQNYLEALALEWELIQEKASGKEICSIYFGGGTPSLIGPEAIASILSWVNKSQTVQKQAEITLEVNPENADLDWMRGYLEAGVNRVSLGVQSLIDEELISIGRGHSAHRAVEAIGNLQKAGFDNISCDLMYDLPRQTMKGWEKTLACIEEMPISHLSFYNLTIEPNTPFYRQKEQLERERPDEDTSLEMVEYARQSLSKAGFEQYEISAYAREGKISRHNTGYWTARPFLGLGPSAFSYFEGKRYRNVCHLNRYAAALKEGASPVDFEEKLEDAAQIRELFAVEIRLLRGVHLPSFQKRHGALPDAMREELQELATSDLLKVEGDTVKLTARGQIFYDTVAEKLV
ncbi:MAG: oxygen-independent coproporphyrinogen-III oxidase-like protein [Chlamydiales bacterium]|nr:oxygen-independent coproporphyrinogen-III oxidase-like protein [Chlamydiales bacterium]